MREKGPAVRFGPFRAPDRPSFVWRTAGTICATFAALGLAACASGEGLRPADPGPVAEASDSTVVVDVDDDSPEGVAVAEAEQAWVDGRYIDAVRLADSLAAEWRRQPGIGPGPTRRLARLLFAAADDVVAVEQFLRRPSALDDRAWNDVRVALERMSLDELRGLARLPTSEAKLTGAVRAELARALALSGDESGGRDLAMELRDADLESADEDKRDDVLEGRVRSLQAGIRIGFLVPRSGGFAPVGDELLQGARLAARHYEAELGVPIELVVMDEAEVEEGLAAPAAGLDTARLAALVGPVRTEALRELAESRAEPGFLVISPTASEDAGLPLHAYSLWDRARRDSSVAEALGEWLASAFRPGRVVALYPEGESGERRAFRFRDAVESAGFEWVGHAAYAPDSTTYAEQIGRLTELDPDFVLAVADGPAAVLQVAPQLNFYGLRGRITLFSQDFTHPMVRRRLDPTFTDYRVAGVYFERAGNPEWRRFADAWDEQYRTTLPENAFAALGWDAVSLVAASVPDPRLVRSAALARAFRAIRAHEGVTGQFSFDPVRMRPVRATRARMMFGRELRDPDPDAILEWSIETRAQEEERLEREAARERRQQQGP